MQAPNTDQMQTAINTTTATLDGDEDATLLLYVEPIQANTMRPAQMYHNADTKDAVLANLMVSEATKFSDGEPAAKRFQLRFFQGGLFAYKWSGPLSVLRAFHRKLYTIYVTDGFSFRVDAREFSTSNRSAAEVLRDRSVGNKMSWCWIQCPTPCLNITTEAIVEAADVQARAQPPRTSPRSAIPAPHTLSRAPTQFSYVNGFIIKSHRASSRAGMLSDRINADFGAMPGYKIDLDMLYKLRYFELPNGTVAQ